jgi:DNA-binding NarL/FixJ family response regulator
MRVLVADDHPLFRSALVNLVTRIQPAAVIHEADTFAAVLARLADGDDYDLLLLDLRMPGGDATATLQHLHRSHPRVPIVIVSASDHSWDVQHALDAGAVGFISKSVSEASLRESLTRILAGDLPAYDAAALIASGDIDHPSPASLADGHSLTARQREVLALMCAGQSNKEIARRLGVSVGTVKLHVCAVLEALDVDNRTQAVVKAQALALHHGNDAAGRQ